MRRSIAARGAGTTRAPVAFRRDPMASYLDDVDLPPSGSEDDASDCESDDGMGGAYKAFALASADVGAVPGFAPDE